MANDKNFVVKNGLEVGGQLIVDAQGNIQFPEGSFSAIEGLYDVTEYTNVQNQTTFELVYDVGLVQVLYNGVQLAQTDFTATDGENVVLDVAVENAEDVITIIRWGAVSESNVVAEAPTPTTIPKRTSSGAIRAAEGSASDEVVTKSQLDLKVDAELGKGLSTEDYTTSEKNKLAAIEAGAEVNTVDSVAGRTGAVVLAKADVGLGNVDNTSDANKPVSTATQTALDLKAPLASPSLSGTPTAPTATSGTNTTQIATTAFVQTAVAGIVDTAPETLDTLNELAAALGDDPNFATTVSTQIGTKLDTSTWNNSAASGITSTQVTNWDTAYGWGDHGSAGYAPASTTVTTNTTQTISGAKKLTSDLTLGSGGGYEDLILKTDTIVSGYNGTFSITPRTVPGSGVASQLTYFKNTISGAGTTRHDVSIDGNVGIGTSSPQRNITINDTLPILQFTNPTTGTTGNDGLLIYQNGVNTVFSNQENGSQIFETNGIEHLRINESGNIGIGTSSPSGRFHVYGTNTAFRIQDSNGGNMQFGQWDGSTNRIEGSGGNRDFYLISYGTGSMRFATNSTDRMTLTGSGNLGIGTNNPVSQLHINSSGATTLTIDSGGTSDPSVISFVADSERAKIRGGYNSGGGGYLAFNTDTAGGTDLERMKITPDGYLRMSANSGGIQFNGDTSASNALDDYEEGTLTMTPLGITSGATGISHLNALYTKVGKLVHIQGEFGISNASAGVLAFSFRSPISMNQNLNVGQLGVCSAYPYSTNKASGYVINNTGSNATDFYMELSITSASTSVVAYSLTYRTD